MEAALIDVFAFVCGAVAGSFVSVVSHRVPRGLSIVAPRSRCPSCETTIAAYDNVPVLSWLALRGRCRHCGAAISPGYPLTELGLGGLYVAIVLAFRGEAAEIALGLVLVTALVTVTVTDLEHRVIPNAVLLVTAATGIAIVAVGLADSLLERMLAAGAAGAALLLVALAYPRGMGMGDVKLAALLGLFLGRAVAPALLIAFLVGAIFGLALIARHGAAARKRAVPFGPFLALGGTIALFVGDEIVDWYLDAFLGE